MTPLLRSALLCALLFSTASAAADSSPTGVAGDIEEGTAAPGGKLDVELLRRIVMCCRLVSMDECEIREPCPPDPRESTPSWMLSRMVVLVPDGTPQLVYRAPSGATWSPDFGR
ncbi:hypothetical protein [Pyxidicoccus trucidator]|uniref:hypothetical protein n=1 Tax=Pyxidicoccus trucidator TaxID=2709662 RepID=UPI0013D97E7A|nr:hypothetical protein [Pyxidicoccus trucidator]